MKCIIALLALLPSLARGQVRVEVATQSVYFWGHAKQTSKMSVAYKSVKLVALYARKTFYDGRNAPYSGLYTAMFWRPVHIEAGRLAARGGIGYFARRFPTVHGTHINFTAEVQLKITPRLGLTYGHISNGFGLFNRLNPGVDNLGISIAL